MLDPLIDSPTVPPMPLAPGRARGARAARPAVAADLLAVPDAALDDPWRWRPTDADDVELRYGCLPDPRAARGGRRRDRGRAARRGRGEAVGAGESRPLARDGGRPLGAPAALCAPLAETVWDADPGGGEWTIRRTFGHIVGGQRSYGWYNAWYLNEPASSGSRPCGRPTACSRPSRRGGGGRGRPRAVRAARRRRRRRERRAVAGLDAGGDAA